MYGADCYNLSIYHVALGRRSAEQMELTTAECQQQMNVSSTLVGRRTPSPPQQTPYAHYGVSDAISHESTVQLSPIHALSKLDQTVYGNKPIATSRRKVYCRAKNIAQVKCYDTVESADEKEQVEEEFFECVTTFVRASGLDEVKRVLAHSRNQKLFSKYTMSNMLWRCFAIMSQATPAQ